ncbi:hypothetical protein BDL97_03G091600 [Sphagnum fallax]|nr:hypothetical protein BDL97_03G091600 [Sphagnum fallax]KAH8967732.1 hypothetical protein BDL97_03G091600 [Sphagnum fallax]
MKSTTQNQQQQLQLLEGDNGLGSVQRGAHIGQVISALQTQSGSIVCEGRVQPLSQLPRRVAALAAGLRRLGLRSGERVAIAALNSEWYLEWLLAVPCAGGIIAPLNYRWSAEEASQAVQQIEAKFLVLDRSCLQQWPDLKQCCPSLQLQVLLGPGFNHPASINAEKVLILAGQNPTLDFYWGPDSVALICFTSGTTGRPKGVAISHNALIVQSLAKIAVIGYSSCNVFLHTSQFCHIGGISSVLATLMAGGSLVILPKFQSEAVLEAVKDHLVTAMIVVPAMLFDLVATSSSLKRHKRTFPSIQTLLNGGGGISAGLLASTKELFPAANIFSAYGMTEACSSMSFTLLHGQSSSGRSYWRKGANTGTLNSRDLGGICVGQAAPHVELQIMDEDLVRDGGSRNIEFFGQNLQNGMFREGRVLTRGLHVMERYWGLPEETAAVLSRDGWLDTGDVGWMDGDGQLWLLGRHKDTIKSGGENVYSLEVETALVKHPGVLAAAVVGIPHERLNEVVAAVIQLQDKWQWEENMSEGDTGSKMLSPNECWGSSQEQIISIHKLQMHCQQLGVSRYKLPRFILAIKEQFPTTSTGKVRKGDLKKLLLTSLAENGRSPKWPGQSTPPDSRGIPHAHSRL